MSLDLNQDGTTDFQMAFNKSVAAKPYVTNTVAGATSSFVLSTSGTQGLPVTAIGTTINSSYQSAQSVGYFNENVGATMEGSWTAAGNIEGYVGLELIDGAGTHYGWAHFIYNAAGVPANDKDTGTLTLEDAAMETTPGQAIQAGQTAEASTGPAVYAPPSSLTGYLGGTAQLSVVATGNPNPSFQWQSGTVGSGIYHNVTLGVNATATTSSDGTTSTLTLYDLTPANMADYVVVISSTAGSITTPVPATLTVVPASDTPATLVHRYSFQDLAGSSSFVDSVGGPSWNGSLAGAAALTGSSLVLNGSSGCYAYLPSDITSDYNQMTVECWVDIGTQTANWTRVFSFGNQTGGGLKQSGVDYSPNATGGYQNLDLLNNSSVDGYANNNAALVNTTGSHITVVADSINGALCYYNGTNVVSTLNTAVPSLADIDDVYNLIGASLVAIDPYLVGTIHEFRIYQGVLSPQAVALNDAVGPANYFALSANPALTASMSGGNIVLSWPASDYNFLVQSRSGLGSGTPWATLNDTPTLVGGTTWQVSILPSGSPQFFQLIYQ